MAGGTSNIGNDCSGSQPSPSWTPPRPRLTPPRPRPIPSVPLFVTLAPTLAKLCVAGNIGELPYEGARARWPGLRTADAGEDIKPHKLPAILELRRSWPRECGGDATPMSMLPPPRGPRLCRCSAASAGTRASDGWGSRKSEPVRCTYAYRTSSVLSLGRGFREEGCPLPKRAWGSCVPERGWEASRWLPVG